MNVTDSIVIAAVLCTLCTSSAGAQSWSSSHARPRLRQLASVDASGEAFWPYGSEDIAQDTVSVFAMDEAGTDLRSVYADADANRVWLRAYVAGESAPPPKLVALFFADTDDRDGTGGPAFGAQPWPLWTTDPTPGGYERAIGVRGDGTLLGVWSWDDQARAWQALSPKKDDAHVELGRDEDPLRIGLLVHGYAQVDVHHSLSGLNASCAGNIFVRTWHDEPAPRSFGDDDAEVFACRPEVDAYGDSVVIRKRPCRSDKDCPNDGRCRDAVCLFASPCSVDGDCSSDEHCTLGSCVKRGGDACQVSADCRGLVCENGACVACAESGARACGDGHACSPNGTCVNPDAFVPGGGASGGGADADAGVVRGGAFHCAARAVNQGNAGAWLWGLAGAWLLRRRARREGGA